MKNIKYYITLSVIAVSMAVTGVSCATTQPAQQVQVSISGFYDALSPYGRWTSYGSYGQVWIPNAGPDFQPYSTAGHWVYSDYGWTWVSDYDWGWAPFHYGRWAFDDAYGWMWLPGTEWGPAWVSWRNSPDYYGWAPLGPGMTIGVNVNIPVGYWSFVPCQYITSPYMNRYYVDRGRRVNVYNNTTVINNTTIINNRTYYRGPATRDVERYTRNEIRPVRVVSDNRPGRSTVDRGEVRMYRPQPSSLQPRRGGALSNGVRDNNDRNNFDRPNTPGRTTTRIDRNNDGRPDNVPDRNNNNNIPNRGNIDRNNDGRPDNTLPGRNIDRNNTRPDNIPDRNNNNIPGRIDDNRPTRPVIDRNNDNRPDNNVRPTTPNRPTFTPAPSTNPANNNNNTRPERFNRPESRPVTPTPTPTPGPTVRPAQPQMPRPQPQQQARPQIQPRPQMSQPQPRPQMQPQAQPRPQQAAPQRVAPSRGGERAVRGN